jgi:DNA sulfur modification protein DndD
LIELNSEYLKIKTEIFNLTEERMKIGDKIGMENDSMKKLDEYNEVKKRIYDLQQKISQEETQLKSFQDDKIAFERALKKNQTMQMKSGNIRKETRYQITNFCNSLFEKIKEILMTQVREYMALKTTYYFKNIIWDRDYWKEIVFDEEWNYKVLDKYNRVFQNLSQGQFHVLGLSFMGALTDVTSLGIPFVFDSPFGRIDEENINEIGKNLSIMMGGSQIILFVTDVEGKNILSSIENRIGKKIKINKHSASKSDLEEF